MNAQLKALPETRNGQPGLILDDQLWVPNEWILEQARQVRYSQNDVAYEQEEIEG